MTTNLFSKHPLNLVVKSHQIRFLYDSQDMNSWKEPFGQKICPPGSGFWPCHVRPCSRSHPPKRPPRFRQCCQKSLTYPDPSCEKVIDYVQDDPSSTTKILVTSNWEVILQGGPSGRGPGLGRLGFWILNVPFSAQFCLGWWEFGRRGWASGQDGGNPSQPIPRPRDHMGHPVACSSPM